jgi:hypothetical protein
LTKLARLAISVGGILVGRTRSRRTEEIADVMDAVNCHGRLATSLTDVQSFEEHLKEVPVRLMDGPRDDLPLAGLSAGAAEDLRLALPGCPAQKTTVFCAYPGDDWTRRKAKFSVHQLEPSTRLISSCSPPAQDDALKSTARPCPSYPWIRSISGFPGNIHASSAAKEPGGWPAQPRGRRGEWRQ